jgi:hypothetical protein
MVGFVTPQQFGAVGDGVADDTSPLSQALNSGSPVLLQGKFKITSQINVALNDSTGPVGCYVQGMGQGASQILIAAAVSFGVVFEVSYSGNGANTNTQVILKDFTVSPVVPGVGTAIGVLGSPEIGSIQPNLVMDNVGVIPDLFGTNFCTNGIFLQNIRNFHIDRCNIVGQSSTNGGAGIGVSSTNNGAAGSAPVDFNITDTHVTFFSVGINLSPATGDAEHQSNDWQGAHVSGCTILSCGTGVNAISDDDTSNGLHIYDCIFNCSSTCVSMINVKGGKIHNNHCQVGANNAIGVAVQMNVNLATPDFCLAMVHDNLFWTAGFTGCTAVFTSGASFSNNKVYNNHSVGGPSYNITGANDVQFNNT